MRLAVRGLRALHVARGRVSSTQTCVCARWVGTSEGVGGAQGGDVSYGLEDDAARRARERDTQMRSSHFSLKTDVPEASLAPGESTVDPDAIRRKRLIYRSKQRGWLEVDLLMGTWAVENVPNLTVDELDQYEDILNRETIDIFNYVTGKEEPPMEIRNSVMEKLQRYADGTPIGDTPAAYEMIKTAAGLT